MDLEQMSKSHSNVLALDMPNRITYIGYISTKSRNNSPFFQLVAAIDTPVPPSKKMYLATYARHASDDLGSLFQEDFGNLYPCFIWHLGNVSELRPQPSAEPKQ
jgi:hypothetical protein